MTEHTPSPQSVVVPVELVNKLVQELAPDQGQSASIAFGLALELQGAIAVPPSISTLRADLNNYVTRCIRSTPEADMSLEEALISRAARALSAPAPSSLASGEVVDDLAAHLASSIANLGFPVGLGIAPGKTVCTTAAQAIIDTYGPRLAALSPEDPAREGETWTTMAKWTEETFGPVSLERIATRANEEMQELLADPSDVMEAADVCIVLSRYPGIEDAINRKMAINRKREWRLNGDGSGYHVKSDDSAAALTPRHEAPACPHDAYETDSAGQPVRCSDCHEAPAEGAGERDDLIARLEEMADFFDGATDPVIAETVCDEHARDLRAALSELRARPSAPEAREGEAVAWVFELATCRDPETGAYSSWNPPQVSLTKPCVPDGSIRNLTPLGPIANPAAPSADKLRIAVEALEPFAEAAESLDDETRDHDHIWEQPAAMSIDAGHLRTARALIANQGADHA